MYIPHQPNFAMPNICDTSAFATGAARDGLVVQGQRFDHRRQRLHARLAVVSAEGSLGRHGCRLRHRRRRSGIRRILA